MPQKTTRKNHRYKPVFARRLWLVGVFVFAVLIWPQLGAHAATLSTASVALSDPRPSNLGTTYTFTGSGVTLSSIKCIKEYFSDTSTGVAVPTGMVTTGATFNAASNYVPAPAAWSLNAATNGTLTLTDATGATPASASARTLQFDGINNSSLSNTAFWLHLGTYSDAACSVPVDSAVVQFILNNGSTLTLTVDNTLSFGVNAVSAGQACAGSTTTAASTATTIPFGTVTAAANAVVCQDLQAATNATNGYTIYARYTSKPTNALNQTIQDLTPGTNPTPAAFSAAGVEAYGYNTNDQTLSTCGGACNANRFYNGATYNWAAMTTSNAEVAYDTVPTTIQTYRVAHQVGVSLITKPGTYATTIIYTCTPIY